MNATALFVLLSSAPVLAPNGLPINWEPLIFPKIEAHTSYEWSESSSAIHAVSVKAASGMIFRHGGPVADTPILRWRWEVAEAVAKGNERERRGDDYAARLYITFQYDPSRAGWATRLKYAAAKAIHGEYPPHNALTYIWANKLAAGEAAPSPYTDRVMMVAVRSGNSAAGAWRSEERNVLEDYRRLFGEDPPPYAGIALMTDTDNTGGSAEAWYADISLSAR
ncbi:MAG: hypothetical protein COV48_02870 [Elusimicrobia bacterium CG11_big_fil_rev_8_21_14_0_20_64_6]|nr:MAG: hypothetical protein COV48_02870 [Elusimicrobia bacterium CG11_big_fil_rev_8_21_14_0_20_64_6]